MIVMCVHMGAGRYGRKSVGSYKELLQSSLRAGIRSYADQPKDLVSVAESIMTVLEDSGIVNTGKGSSLTENLQVECDGIMIRASDGAIGTIIASPDNGNPSATVASLLRESCLGLEYQQLLRPCILIGEAATEYAKKHSVFKTCKVSEKRINQGKRYQTILDKKRKYSEDVQDTVGCIVFSDEDIVVSGSSGGNWMRHSGRGGLCSVPGAGVWCEEGKGCVCSGFGESCIRTLLAKRICDVGMDEEMIRFLLDTKLGEDMKRMRIEREPSFGVLSIVASEKDKPQLLAAHNSPHFAYGYVVIRDGLENETHVQLSETNNGQCTITRIDL